VVLGCLTMKQDNGNHAATPMFKAWRSRLGITQAGAAELLGKHERTIQLWERGVNQRGKRVEIPRAVKLACRAIEQDKKKPGS